VDDARGDDGGVVSGRPQMGVERIGGWYRTTWGRVKRCSVCQRMETGCIGYSKYASSEKCAREEAREGEGAGAGAPEFRRQVVYRI
jgi:hypothetical protein